MDFNVKTGDSDKLRSACVVVGVASPRRLSPAALRLDKAGRGQLSELLKSADIDTDCGKTTLILNPRGRIQAARILVVGCGKDKHLTAQDFTRVVTATARALQSGSATEAVSFLAELDVEDRDLAWKTQRIVEATRDALYRFDELKSEAKPPRRPLRKLTVAVADRAELASARLGVSRGTAIANGIELARILGNRPGNLCTPADLAV